MKYIIGVDAGGTKTECIIADADGNILSEVTTLGGNPLIIGIGKSAENILTAINECNKKIKVNYDEVSMAVIGSAGTGRKEDADKMLNELKRTSNIRNIKVTTDANIALEGAFSGSPGCILIAGTGSIIYGKDERGKLHRVGGFGSIIGDQGGGYSIGRKGLTAVSKELDGRGNKTLLTELVKEKFNIKNFDGLIAGVYNKKLPVPDAAPLVIQAAEQDDEAAIKILNDESGELIEHIIAIKKKLKLEKLKLAFSGSLIGNKNYYSNLLRKRIKEELKFVEVTEAENSPAAGAVLLAKKYLTDNK